MRLTKFVKWLNLELPKLVGQGFVTDENAEKIRAHYQQEVAAKGGINIVLGIFAVIGAICIGLGVILFFAFGWDNFSRLTKTFLAFMPLLISLALVSWAILTQKKSFVVREGFSVFNILSVGAAIALISQIYHVPGEFDRFLLTWMLLSVPLVYLLSSTLAAVSYLIGVSFWAANAQNLGGNAILFWPLAGAVIPYFWKHLSTDRFSMSSLWLSFAICVSLSVGMGVSLEKVVPGLWAIVYSAFFAALYLAGKLWFDDGEGFWQRPFRNYGMAGLVVLSYIFTFKWVWADVGWRYCRAGWGFQTDAGYIDYLIVAILFVTALIFLVRAVTQKRFFESAFGVIPVIATLCYSIASSSGNEYISSGIFSAYLFFLGGLCIYFGVREIRLDLTNCGILISGVVLLTRFLDTSLGILERSLVFMIIGAAFILTNMFLSKKVKKEAVK